MTIIPPILSVKQRRHPIIFAPFSHPPGQAIFRCDRKPFHEPELVQVVGHHGESSEPKEGIPGSFLGKHIVPADDPVNSMIDMPVKATTVASTLFHSEVAQRARMRMKPKGMTISVRFLTRFIHSKQNTLGYNVATSSAIASPICCVDATPPRSRVLIFLSATATSTAFSIVLAASRYPS